MRSFIRARESRLPRVFLVHDGGDQRGRRLIVPQSVVGWQRAVCGPAVYHPNCTGCDLRIAVRFGDVGPYRDRSAYDTVIQAYAGIASSQADPDDGQPVFLQQVVADKVTALYASQAVTVALFARAVGRGGQHLHLSMVDAVVSFSGPTPRAITEAPRVSCTLGVL